MNIFNRVLAVVLIVAALSAANLLYYSNRMRELNSVTIRSNPLGGDVYQIGAQAARDRQNTFWIVEAAIIVGGAALLFVRGKGGSVGR